MATISLKVTLVDQNTTKTVQFAGNMSVGECCRDLRDKVGGPAGPTDHGLFSLQLNKWLDNKKTLDFYDLSSGDAVEYKKKHRPLRIRLMDDTQKTVLIDDSAPVVEIVASACQRFGISNPDEYSLQTEHVRSERPDGAPVADSLRRKPQPTTHDGQNGGDDGRWLSPEKTLSEQGVLETDILLLKKKFFFSDQNIDRNDPIQLNLLYVQARDAIVCGKHPCTNDEAAQLAALQCQIQYSNHEPDKHKPGFIDVKEFVPPEYHKEKKELEKRIFQEHRKLQGLSELNAKFRYVQLCRTLKTYGVTFFHVMEKPPKKGKLIPRLLGVTRDCVMRMDTDTKEVLKTWPLTTLRRWAASPNSFTLDFGDYAEAYYSVQTTEGEQLSQLIAGYIDIILKKRKESARVSEQEDEQVAISEELMRPAKASGFKVLANRGGRAQELNIASSGVMMDDENRFGANGMRQITRKKHTAQGVDMGDDEFAAKGAQQALLQNIVNGFASVNAAQSDLAVATQLPPIGNDPASQQWRSQTSDVNKQMAAAQISAHLAATCSIINISSTPDVENLDFVTFGANVAAMSSNITSIASSIKMVAALMDSQQGDKLLDAARSLAAQTTKFLNSVQPVIVGAGFQDPKVKQDLLGSAQELSKIGFQLLYRLGEMEVSEQVQQELIALAKAVVDATVALVSQGAKPIANESAALNMSAVQKEIVQLAKQTASAAETLVTTTMVAAPAVNMALCQDQLLQGTLQVKDAMDSLSTAAEPVRARSGNDSKIMMDLTRLSTRVSEAMAKLVARAKNYKDSAGEVTEFDRNFDAVMSAVEHMLNDTTTSANVVSGARELTVATTQMVNYLKASGSTQPDSEAREKALSAGRTLADSTGKMVAIAREVARTPTDADKQEKLRQSVEAIQRATMSSGPQDIIRAKLFRQLVDVSKCLATSSTQLVTAAKAIAPSNRNQASQMELNRASKTTSDAMGALISASRASAREPDDSTAQSKLMAAAKLVIPPVLATIAASKVAAATTRDEVAQGQLINCSQVSAVDVQKLARLVEQAELASRGIELDSALQRIKQLQDEVTEAKQQAAASQLRPQYNQTADLCAAEINAANKLVVSTVQQLVSAAPQQSESLTGVAAIEAANSLQAWIGGVKGLAACSEKDKKLQKQLLDVASNLTAKMSQLVAASKSMIATGSADDSAVTAVGEEMRQIVGDVSKLMPGQRDVEHAINVVSAGLDLLQNGPMIKAPSGAADTFQVAQTRMNAASAALASAANALVTASRSGAPAELKAGSAHFEEQFNKFVVAAQSLLAQTGDESSRQQVVSHVKTVGDASLALLGSARQISADPTSQNFRNLLNVATMGVADAIGKLIEACTVSAPGTTQCNQADQLLMQATAKVDSILDASMATRQDSYFDCLAVVTTNAKSISTQLATISAAAKTGDGQRIGDIVLEAALAMSELADSTVRAAYLVGISDPSSTPAVSGIVDPAAILSSVQDVTAAVEKLADPRNGQQQILAAASVIAKHTALLCTACKQSAQDPKVSAVCKQQFIQSAKSIASSTAALVGSIKVLAATPSDSARAACSANATPLIDAVQQLQKFSTNPELAPTPASISPVAMQRVEPLLETNRRVIAMTQDVVSSTKTMCGGQIDQMSVQLLGSQIKAIGDSLKMLVNTVKSSAPGQKDCDDAMAKISGCVSELDDALVKSEMGDLNGNADLQGQVSGDSGYRDALLDNAQALLSLIPMICQGAKGKAVGTNGSANQGVLSAGQLGAAAQQFAANFQPTTTTAVRLAATSDDKKLRKAVLDAIKDVGEATMALLFAAKASGGDATATEAHAKLDQQRTVLETALSGAIEQLEGSAQGTKEMNQLAESLQKQLRLIPLDASAVKLVEPVPGDNYQVYAQEIVANGKTLASLLGEVMSKSAKPTTDVLSPLVDNIGKAYLAISVASQKASSMNNDMNVRQSLLDAARDLGGSSMKLIDSLKAALVSASNSPNGQIDPATRQKIGNATREMSQGVTKMVGVAKEGSKGVMVCEQALEQIADIVVDLESQIMFAQAGQLDPTDARDIFANYKDNLQALAKDFVDQAKAFVTAAASSNQDVLAQCATTTIQTVVALKDTSKKAAWAITSKDSGTQEQLLSATKYIAETLSKLIQAAMVSSGKAIPISATGTIAGGAMSAEVAELRNSAKSMVLQVQEYIKVIKQVGDESSRGARSVDSAIRDMTNAANLLSDGSPAEGNAMPEEVATAAKAVATSAAQMVSVSSRGNAAANQDELVQAATELKKFMINLLKLSKSATDKAPDDKRTQMYDAVRGMVDAANQLLGQVKLGLEDASSEHKSRLQAAAKSIADSAGSVVEAVGTLIPGGYVDPNDPDVIAERELLAAASSIEAAARKLAQLKPPERPREADEDLNFEEQILEAAKAIAAATGALVRSATTAQREIVAKTRKQESATNVLAAKDKNKKAAYFSDGTWSEGLVSAAKQVAYATGDLCEAANAAVKGEVQRERVVAAAKGVSSSTAQLMAAAAAKADASSQAQTRLRAAGKSVTQATEQLVRAAQESMAFQETESVTSMMKDGGGSVAAQRARELDAQAKVLQMEKELEMARSRLTGLRKGKYAK